MKLNIACGHSLLKNYINYDLVSFTNRYGKTTDILGDLRELDKKFESLSIDEIVAFHCLEHLTISDVKSVLDQCYTILKQGGTVRVECPDMIKAFDYYVIKKNDPRGYAHAMMGGDSKRYGETWAHKSMWSGKMMAEEMKRKFKNVRISDGTSHGNPLRDFRIDGEKQL